MRRCSKIIASRNSASLFCFLFLHRSRCVRAALLFTLSLLQACSGNEDAGENRQSKPQAVLTQAVQWQQRNTLVEAVGTSRAQQTTMLYPKVSDIVTAVMFQAGDRVAAGQSLVQLDDRDERLALALAKVEVADAERLYERYVNSKGAGAVTESTLDVAKSNLEQARIRLQRAQVVLQDHAIVAPFAGVMGLTDIDPGSRVTLTTPIATIDDRSTLLVSFEVPEVFYDQLQPGQALSLDTWSANGAHYQGTVAAIDSQIDAQARTFAVRATVDNQDDRLRPGMSFKVRLALSDGRYPAVPENALQWGGDGAFVWTVEEGKATRVAATVVQRIKGKVLIDADLENGAQVVYEGAHRVREGQQVEVVNSAVVNSKVTP